MQDPLDVLKGIKQVDTPPFLMTRIKQKILDRQKYSTPKSWYFSVGLSFALLCVVNFFAIMQYQISNLEQKDLVQVFDLHSSNNLYDYESSNNK